MPSGIWGAVALPRRYWEQETVFCLPLPSVVTDTHQSARLALFTLSDRVLLGEGMNSHAHFTDREMRLIEPERGLAGPRGALR